ncbi:zinc-finger protein DPF3 [Culex quinquefasciatus]|uniref:Zinc-finger protein DPF3 n=1 Tax=Culex quinquefasciatus TaxID=7176 RepID=B0X7E9_CULQU|nr:zinc finger protein DPF3 [Culex quinquefasciatus]EDS41899.1 zinc-finger protein DPF3 [Culex quinquefasciatus]|eukprot:XP_001865571.1 zinc-finger protein DPF3 [Culex quinquefasciatus]
MASVGPVEFREIKLQNVSKIEALINDSAYKEGIENSETFNTRLCIERRQRMPFLDPQTGVAQYHSALFMKARQRMPGLKVGQIYSYPAARWRKSRRQYLLQKQHPAFPAYTNRPFGHLTSSYDAEGSNLDSATSSVDAEGGKDMKEDPGQDWYYDEMDMHEMETYDDHELPDSDCDFDESYSSRKKRSKGGKGGSSSSKGKASVAEPNTPKRGRGSGRGRGRKSQGVGDSPSTKEAPEASSSKKVRQQPPPPPPPQHVPAPPAAIPSSPLTVPPEEPPMPVLVPEHKPFEEPEERPNPVKPGPSASAHMHAPSAAGSASNATAPATAGPPPEKGRAVPSPYCDFCLGDARENKKTFEAEELVSCSDCGRSGHPTCLQFTANMIISVRKYRWQCIECKYCTMCGTSDNDDQLLFCDDCDRGYHMYCLSPPLISPPEGSWSCALCTAEFHRK